MRSILAIFVICALGGACASTSLAHTIAPPQPGSVPPAEVERALGGEVRVTDAGLYRVETGDGTSLTTHGPDLRDAIPDPVANHGTGLGPGDPERAPLCAANPATDRFQEVLYGYWDPAGAATGDNQVASVRGPIQAHMRRINAVLNEEGLASGNLNADYIVRCDGADIRVSDFPVSTASGTSQATFSDLVASAQAAGFTNNLADYSIFYDGPGPAGTCGVGSFRQNDNLSASNANNNPGGATTGGYGVTFRSCWYGLTPMHENGHNQGAVQRFAPQSTGLGAHCWDEIDVMCYSPDGGDVHQEGTVTNCADYLHFDCGWDTYFDAVPEPGEWLASHWNLGSPLNRFIIFRTAAGNTSPAADFEVSCNQLACSFTDTSEDGDGTIESYAWSFGDGSTSSTQNPAHTYGAAGNYDVTLTVEDDDGDSTSLTRQVAPGPPPANDDLANAEPLSGSFDAATGSNLRATKQAGEPSHAGIAGGDGGASVWYRWTAPASGTALLSTCGSSFDTLLAVYTGTEVTSLTSVASNDDSQGPVCAGSQDSEAAFEATAGATYRIAVDGFDPPGTAADDPVTGSVAIGISLTSPVPASDPGPSTPLTPSTETLPTTTVLPVEEPGADPPRKSLRSGKLLKDSAGARGGRQIFTIAVPRRTANLRVTLGGPRCVASASGCVPDLDLYLRTGDEPTDSVFDCASTQPGPDERCRIRRPPRGTVYAAVHNLAAAEGTQFQIKAVLEKRR